MGSSTTEDRSQLAKTTKDGFAFCEKAKSDSDTKLNDETKDAHQSYNTEIESMNERHDQIKAHERIWIERTRIHAHLPTNPAVTSAHNALVEVDVKEGMLIAESFRAVKIAKAEIREKLDDRIEKARQVHDAECVALGQQIACLRDMAELSGVELDGEEAEEGLPYESVPPMMRLHPSNPAHSNSHARETASSHARSKPSTAANADRRPKVETASQSVKKDCYNCSHLQEELRIVSTPIPHLLLR